MLKKAIGKFVYFIFGWKLSIETDMSQVKRSVMIAAPHTSNWDFLFALAGFWILGLDVRYFIKNSYTKSPLGFLFRWSGAMGVDRSQRNNLVEHAVHLLETREQLVILVPAEGTRSKVDKWKKGFYHIATSAKVPISLGFLDYANKTGGVADVFNPSGDEVNDFTHIQEIYKRYMGKNPEDYNEQIF